MPPELTVVGSVNLDLVARVARLPRPGETIGGAELERVPGGKGANQAVAAARLGARVTMVGAVGEDELAAEALAELESSGVILRLERRGATGIALILVDDDGENQIVVVPGANGTVRPEPVEGALLCQLELPVEAVQAAAAGSGFFCLNAAPARSLPAELVERADLVVVNRLEREALPVEPRLTALTLGAEGAVLLERGEEVARARPPAIEAVDGTAAGDAFTACLLVSLLEQRARGEALCRACAAGALAASRFGAQPSLPTTEELDAFLAGS
ncbi:MAG: ribokinase [Actinobacteria bacterium]|nr:ribokinase [Actinomycetota bacterium]